MVPGADNKDLVNMLLADAHMREALSNVKSRQDLLLFARNKVSILCKAFSPVDGGDFLTNPRWDGTNAGVRSLSADVLHVVRPLWAMLALNLARPQPDMEFVDKLGRVVEIFVEAWYSKPRLGSRAVTILLATISNVYGCLSLRAEMLGGQNRRSDAVRVCRGMLRPHAFLFARKGSVSMDRVCGLALILSHIKYAASSVCLECHRKPTFTLQGMLNAIMSDGRQ